MDQPVRLSPQQSDELMEAITEYNFLKRQGETPDIEEFVEKFESPVKDALLDVLSNPASNDERKTGWEKLRQRLYPDSTDNNSPGRK